MPGKPPRHSRFVGAPTAVLRCPGGEVSAAVADGFRLRLLGLMILEAGEIEPVLFPRCRSIHTCFMRSPIDVVWLETRAGLERARVIGVVAALEPGRRARAPKDSSAPGPLRRRRAETPSRGIAALELRSGDAERLGLTAAAELEMRFS